MERVAIIKKPMLSETSNGVVLSSKIILGSNERELWFQFSKEYSSNIDIELQDWALLALIIPAMREGVFLEFECSLSPLLLHHALDDNQVILISQMRDLNKVSLVLSFPLSYDYLDVCVGSIEQRLSTLNCGFCVKCIRQLITLDFLESLDKYHKVFNINDYQLNRQKLFYILAMNVLNPERLNNSNFDVFVLAFEKNRINFVILNLLIKSSGISWKIRNFWAKKLSQKFSFDF